MPPKGSPSGWRDAISTHKSSKKKKKKKFHNGKNFTTPQHLRPANLKLVTLSMEAAAVVARNLNLDAEHVHKQSKVPFNMPEDIKKDVLEGNTRSYGGWLAGYPHVNGSWVPSDEIANCLKIDRKDDNEDPELYKYHKPFNKWLYHFAATDDIQKESGRHLVNLLTLEEKLDIIFSEYLRYPQFLQQTISAVIYEYILRRKCEVNVHDIIGFIREKTRLPGNGADTLVVGALSHAITEGYFMQPHYKERFIVLDYKQMQKFSVYLDSHHRTDFIVADIGYAIKYNMKSIPIYMIDAKTTRNIRWQAAASGQPFDLSEEVRLRATIEYYTITELLQRAETDENVKQYLENNTNGFFHGDWKLSEMEYEYWKVNMASGVRSLDDREDSRYNHSQAENIYTVLDNDLADVFSGIARHGKKWNKKYAGVNNAPTAQ